MAHGLLSLLAACGGESTAVAYTGGTIWDGTGASLVTGTLVVDSGRIVAAGADVDVPRGATVVSLEGEYVIPGLITPTRTSRAPGPRMV
jgi:imidazolonepropionase-like amidohydrolase